jgi:hypothetical protein
MAINSWSHSRVVDFERCRFVAWLKYDQRVPEPARALPPGKTEHANDRGTRVHQSCEDYVSGISYDLTPEAEKHFGFQIAFLRTLYEEGMVSLEGEWGLDRGWNPTEYATAWHRCKLDAIVHWSPTHATVIDYKTGKKFGNEIKHGEQMQLYVINTFMRYPELEEVTAELWYLDQDQVSSLTFTRMQALKFKKNWDARGHRITSCTDFPPNGNIHSCKWCYYGTRPDGQGSGHCKSGVFR